jgi:hypothetical protein
LQPSDEEIMREQEEKLKAKYGGMKPKKKLIQKVRAPTAVEPGLRTLTPFCL